MFLNHLIQGCLNEGLYITAIELDERSFCKVHQQFASFSASTNCYFFTIESNGVKVEIRRNVKKEIANLEAEIEEKISLLNKLKQVEG